MVGDGLGEQLRQRRHARVSSRGPSRFSTGRGGKPGENRGILAAARPEEFVGARLTGRFSTSSPRDVCVTGRCRRPRSSGFPTDRIVAVGQRSTRVTDVRGRARQTRGRAGHGDAVDFDEHVARLRMRVGEQFAHRVDGRDRGLGRLERGEHLGLRTRPDPRGHDAVELLPVLRRATRSSRSVRRRRRRGARARASRPTRPRSRSRPSGRRRTVRAARHGVRDAGAEARLVVVEVRGRRRQRRHHLQHRLEQVDVDDLTLTRAVAVAQRDHHRERARERGDLVGERDRREQRRAVGLAVDRGEAAHRLRHRREPRTRRVRTVLAEAGDAQDHEPGVARVQHVGTEAEPLERAGPEVLDQHVGAGREVEQRRAPGVGLEVADDAALAPAEQLPRVRVAAFGREPAHAAHAVAARALRP